MDIVDYLEALEKIDIQDAAEKTILKTKKELADLNREQLGEGLLSTNDKIHWLADDHYPYVKPYARRRQNLGLQTDVVDLKVNGSFWDSIDVVPEGDEMIFFSQNEIAQYLEGNYGKEIYGLTDAELDKYIEEDFEEPFYEELNVQSGLF
jgi:hypothetical protein